MPGKINHRFVNPVPDEGVTSETGPNEWNDSLVIGEGADGDAFVRRTAVGDGWSLEPRGVPLAFSNVTAVNNSGTGETDLHAYTLPVGHFNATKRAIRFRGMGSTLNNANTKTLKVKFGAAGSITLNPTTTAPNNLKFEFEVTIFRTGANTQRFVARLLLGTGVELISTGTFAETEAGALALKCTGQSGTGSDDITLNVSTVEFLN